MGHFPEGIALGLSLSKHENYFLKICLMPLSRARRAPARHGAFALYVAVVATVIGSVNNHFNAIEGVAQWDHLFIDPGGHKS